RGASAISVTLNYTDNTTSSYVSRLVPDFGNDPGATLYPANYSAVTGQEIVDLIDDMGRLNGINATTGAFTRTGSDRAVFALGFPVSPSRTLASFSVEYLGEVTAVDA